MQSLCLETRCVRPAISTKFESDDGLAKGLERVAVAANYGQSSRITVILRIVTKKTRKLEFASDWNASKFPKHSNPRFTKCGDRNLAEITM